MRGTCLCRFVRDLIDHSWSMLQELAVCDQFLVNGVKQQVYCSVQARVPKNALSWLAQQYVPATNQAESINPQVKNNLISQAVTSTGQ